MRLNDGQEANRWLNNTPTEFRGWEYNYLKHTIQGYTATHALSYTASDLDVSNNGKLIAVAGADSAIHIYDAQTFTSAKTYSGHTNNVYAVDFFANDAKLVSCSRDFTIRVWDTRNDLTLWQTKTKAQGICDVAGSADGKWVALCSWYRNAGKIVGLVQLYDAISGELKWETTFGEKPLVAIKFSHDGKYLAAAGWNAAVGVWDVNTKEKNSNLILLMKTITPQLMI